MEPLNRVQVLVAMGVTAVILLIIATTWRRLGALPDLTLTWDPTDLGLGLGLGVLITCASAIVYQLWGQYRQSADLYLRLILSPLQWIDLLWLGLLPGLSEELLFRGVMLPAFGLNTMGLITSSLLFGVLHISGRGQWPYVVWASIVGLVLGYSTIATGNLLVPVVAHMLTNWITSITWKLRNPSQPNLSNT